ncbi:MAG: FKBP-type peptidyl-prolyl cis-trans isomerase [Deltaproteobacteria bacterium]|nr:FKBP-type peptidyl-prolyl cis-trans isomerase [Deltaproteobacteria bacterium]
MRTLARLGLPISIAALLAGCPAEKKDEGEKKPAEPAAQATKPVEAAKPAEGPGSADIPAPEDVAAAPADAQKTASGLAYKVLKDEPGDEKPFAWDNVEVHYTGWTTDGKMFDSSVKRGQPAKFPLNGVIAGWTEGVQLMSKGDKFRFWIPQDLAYKGQPGAPAGMLVFDVELLNITRGTKPPDAPADVGEVPADATKTKSGLAYKVLKKGDGKTKPNPWDMVEMHFTAWNADGKFIQSSRTRNQPAKLPLERAMPGWKEGLQLMTKGAEYRFWIPEAMAPGGPPAGPKGFIVFDLELLDVTAGTKPPPAPKDVAAPPKDAKKTASGLAYKVLKKGDGKTRPTATSQVTVHYSGWTTDGQMFDSSVTRGQPTTFGLGAVIPGWTEGLQLMDKGSKYRLWIPEELAYKGRPGAPQGMLVFDVELIDVK